jgi:hypothetical protein
MKIWIYLCLAVLLLLTLDTSQAQNRKPKAQTSSDKVYRWVDEQGNVHYTETLPPDFKDKKTDVLDNQGLTRETDLSLVPPPPKAVPSKQQPNGELPRDKSGMVRPEPLYSDSEMQKQQDALLVLRYHSEAEIEDALQVEVRQLAYDTNLLTTSRTSMETAYKGSVKELADRQRAGLELPPEELKNIETLKRKMAANERNLEEILLREQTIREKFAADLERYRNLVEQNATEEL